MKTVTVKISEGLAIRLEKRAKRYGVSKSTLIRKSLEREMADECVVQEEPSAYDLMKKGMGCIDSGVDDLATNPEYMKEFGR